MKKLHINWDKLGIATSLICAVHCVLLPLVLTSLPFFGVNIIHNKFFEWAMIFIAFAVGVQALLHSYKKHHQNILPILYFFIGIILLVTKQFFISAETYFVIPAVACIIYAHTYNFTLSKKAKCSSPYHVH